jgi:hypothetical protein
VFVLTHVFTLVEAVVTSETSVNFIDTVWRNMSVTLMMEAQRMAETWFCFTRLHGSIFKKALIFIFAP